MDASSKASSSSCLRGRARSVMSSPTASASRQGSRAVRWRSCSFSPRRGCRSAPMHATRTTKLGFKIRKKGNEALSLGTVAEGERLVKGYRGGLGEGMISLEAPSITRPEQRSVGNVRPFARNGTQRPPGAVPGVALHERIRHHGEENGVDSLMILRIKQWAQSNTPHVVVPSAI
ncbi:exported hypothetical protein [Candidatus Defluviicoccus seviourii]|uniref:Uncharacterized protein n=1 Tax=Candidatus Defluviicoccus seviourii TaxID=2565273 RepID=A0A564WFA3_9PROT|nr:exported hypothetical protein [Candidatus Defluviicoccus seviourii]